MYSHFEYPTHYEVVSLGILRELLLVRNRARRCSVLLYAKWDIPWACPSIVAVLFTSTNIASFNPYNSPEGQSTIQREWDTYNPILDPSLQIMQCNDPGAAAQEIATIASGDDITAYWNEWPHTIGPLIVWMVACPGDCASIPSDGWFKIDQAGLISGNIPDGVWGQAQMINNNNSWTTTIPSALAPGNYLIRHELISIHTSNEPQFYPEYVV